MYTTTTVLAAALCSLVSAWPTAQILPRAGGPTITPIPDNCTITYPNPSYANFIPTADTITNAQLYPSYFEPVDKSTAALTCLEQCYGYGFHTECGGAYYAENIPIPKGYFGSDGTQKSAGCLLFTRALTADDFEQAADGDAINAFTGDISCPTS